MRALDWDCEETEIATVWTRQSKTRDTDAHCNGRHGGRGSGKRLSQTTVDQ